VRAVDEALALGGQRSRKPRAFGARPGTGRRFDAIAVGEILEMLAEQGQSASCNVNTETNASRFLPQRAV
jgi:hypothetical protein